MDHQFLFSIGLWSSTADVCVNLEMKFILIDVLKVYVLNIDEIKLNTKIFLSLHKSGVSYPQTCLCLLHFPKK